MSDVEPSEKKASGRSVAARLAVVAVVVAAVVAVVALKLMKPAPTDSPVRGTSAAPAEEALPLLVDLGAGTCIPCKMMAPILDQLAKDFDGRLTVEVIDINRVPEAKDMYGISIIPTQVFFDPAGVELYRHSGFMSREDILTKWKSLGYDLEKDDDGGSA